MTLKKKAKIKVIEIIPSFQTAGAETIATKIACGLPKENFEVLAVALYSKPRTKLYGLLKKNNIRIIFLAKKHGVDLSLAKKLRKTIINFEPDIIHIHKTENLKYVLLASLNTRIPLVFTLHSELSRNLGIVRYLILRLILLNRRIHPINLSKTINKQICKNNFCKIINNGISIKKNVLMPKDNLTQINLLALGRLAKVKNQSFIIRCFAKINERYPNTILTVAGRGATKKVLEDLTSRLKLRNKIKFVEQNDNLTNLLADTDICLHSSLYEGQPLTILEEMAHGKPIISSDVGACSEMLSDKSLIYRSGDEKEFIERVAYLIEHPLARRKIGSRLRLRAHEYSLKKMINNYAKYFDHVANR